MSTTTNSPIQIKKSFSKRMSMRKIGSIALIIATFALVIPAAILGPYVLRVQRFKADPVSGYHADFFLYVSPAAKSAALAHEHVTILVQPNNSGTSSDDAAVHRRDAWWTGFERRKIADELGIVLLVPAFIRPGEDWYIYTHALDRDSLTTERPDLRRIDLQLIAMIDQARAELARDEIETDEKILIQGFSASAMFANRFTVLHPERVKAATIGSPGGWPIAPVAEFNGEVLIYPAGVANLEVLTGKAFDTAAYNSIPQLIYMGSLDDNDSLDFTDGWDEAAAQQVDKLFGADPLSRWDDAESIYLATGANVEFLLSRALDMTAKDCKNIPRRFSKMS